MSESEDFAALFEKSLKAKPVRKGQSVEGTIVAINAKGAFVDVGGKGEAMIDAAELKDDEGRVQVKVGDRIHAVVTSTEGGLTLSYKLARGAATNRQLEDAYRSGLTVEGKVEREVKGGYEIRIGGTRAFCPFSQIDIRRSRDHDRGAGAPGADNAQHVGRVYEFRITEYAESGRNIIVSRRALLEEQQKADAAEVRRSIVVDAVLTGRVASVRDFGAFIDLGAGVQGLLHASEMGWSRVVPSQVVETGQPITVKVLRVEDDGQKIALGLKQLLADPWTKVAATYAVEQVRTGRVTRLADFGAFVELEPGIEALAHVSTFEAAGHAKDWKKAFAIGTTAPFEIVSIDVDKRRIGVKPSVETSTQEIDAPIVQQEAPERLGSFADQLRNAIKR
ncbi:MAG TPA: S1 RNA-binding domain-containing protein [Vicinamibacterales bacterium]|nr:S1 RNA-binding domain-containing protein [Vicinamibacterales bacterium]